MIYIACAIFNVGPFFIREDLFWVKEFGAGRAETSGASIILNFREKIFNLNKSSIF